MSATREFFTQKLFEEAAKWTLAARHLDGYWRGCVNGNYGRVSGFCDACDALAVLLGPNWSRDERASRQTQGKV